MANRMQYQYETSPRKIEQPYTRKKVAVDKQKNKKTNLSTKKQTKHYSKASTIIYLIIGFAIILGLGYRNAQIGENFAQLQSLKEQLAALEKENEQLEVIIENNLNLSSVEESAKELLGMQKLDNSQKVYITLPKRNYVEPATEKVVIEESNWLTEIIKMIKNLL